LHGFGGDFVVGGSKAREAQIGGACHGFLPSHLSLPSGKVSKVSRRPGCGEPTTAAGPLPTAHKAGMRRG
jgi:hypothetical protein